MSEAWLRNILRRKTEEARTLLREWQEKVLAYVQSTQLDSAAILPPLLSENPSDLPPPCNTPFSSTQRAMCRFDGEIEDPPDARNPKRRHLLMEVEDLFTDHHVKKHRGELLEGVKPKPDYLLPLTGAQVSRMPHYRLLGKQNEEGDGKYDDDDDEDQGESMSKKAERREAARWKEKFCEDYRLNIAVGQMHEHKDTCFKYVIEAGLRKSKHCRFNFNHFVEKAVKCAQECGEVIRNYVFARAGKELVLPRRPGQAVPNMAPVDSTTGELIALRPTNELGASVITDDRSGKKGRVQPIRWNPLEGSSNPVAQVITRGNCDYQCMLRTFSNGFHPAYERDELREEPLPEEEMERRQQKALQD